MKCFYFQAMFSVAFYVLGTICMSLFLDIFSNSGTLLYGSEEKPTCLYLYEINYKVKHRQSVYKNSFCWNA